MKSEVYKRKVDTPNQLLARILGVAACIKKREGQLRRTTRDLCERVAVRWDFETFIANCNRSVISVLKRCLLHFKLRLNLLAIWRRNYFFLFLAHPVYKM